MPCEERAKSVPAKTFDKQRVLDARSRGGSLRSLPGGQKLPGF